MNLYVFWNKVDYFYLYIENQYIVLYLMIERLHGEDIKHIVYLGGGLVCIL